MLEIRLTQARGTKNVDLRVMDSPCDLLAHLQEAGRLDLGDSMALEILPDGGPGRKGTV